ncbi:MAG: class I SAM-dependent methyltransferase, partial [Alphaproteobacteria bacterium]
FDFMLDDGLHVFDAVSCLFTHSIQHLAQHGIYVIEDVDPRDLLRYKEFFSKTSYIVDYVTLFRPNLPLGDNSLVVIRKG